MALFVKMGPEEVEFSNEFFFYLAFFFGLLA